MDMKKFVFLLLVIVLFPLTGCDLVKNTNGNSSVTGTLSIDDAKKKAEEFINKNLMQAGTTATVQTITDDGSFYKMVVDVGGGKTLPAYMTKDGMKFIPEVIDMTEFAKQKEATGQANASSEPPAVVVPKTDTPVVDLFVMSYCPYGTQIEKGILPVLETLGDTIQFRLRFVDYAMHEEQEIQENLLQYCIQKEQPEKLQAYLSCFLKSSDSTACLKTAKVATLDTCISATDKKYEIMKKYKDKTLWTNGSFPPFDIDKEDNTKYGVQGSPTLVINGMQAQSARDAASLLKTICSAFTSPPEACVQELSTAQPSPGFGDATTPSNASTTNAGCGQ
jgi:hypothetical protein